MRTFAFIACTCMLCIALGCAESSGPRSAGEEEPRSTSFIFPGKTPGEVMDAATRIFKLAGDKGITFYTWPGGMICRREYKPLGILRIAGGAFEFRMTAGETGDGAWASLLITRMDYGAAGTVMPDNPGNHPAEPANRITAGRVETLPGTYNLFFDRMRSLLYGGVVGHLPGCRTQSEVRRRQPRPLLPGSRRPTPIAGREPLPVRRCHEGWITGSTWAFNYFLPR